VLVRYPCWRIDCRYRPAVGFGLIIRSSSHDHRSGRPQRCPVLSMNFPEMGSRAFLSSNPGLSPLLISSHWTRAHKGLHVRLYRSPFVITTIALFCFLVRNTRIALLLMLSYPSDVCACYEAHCAVLRRATNITTRCQFP
jgi:hypothetical protein